MRAGIMMYPAIEDHGIIGNLRTAALVSTDGTVDFFCPLRFDNPTLFASLLDEASGGSCSIRPAATQYRRKQFYIPDTNVLITRFLAPEGIAEITDFMPIAGNAEQTLLIREVSVTRGNMQLRFQCQPRFDYASVQHRTSASSKQICFAAEAGTLHLQSDRTVSVIDGDAISQLGLQAGDHATFVLTYAGKANQQPSWPVEAAETLLQDTVRYWRSWVAECTYHGRWRETVVRSALVLKLLTYQPTGAIVAAPTFALPEQIGGVRNWDYRYTWLRDAAMTLTAFMRLGYHREAMHFMQWLKDIASSETFAGELQIMYGIEGEKNLAERELSSLQGYEHSHPVRIGNAAHQQLQLDVYGAIGAAAWFEVNAGMMIEYDRWNKIRSVLTALSKSWTRPDNGLWEIRGEPREFLHSRLMCWVAYDRAIKIAQLRSLPAPLEQWRQTRDKIYESIHTDFWNDELQSFVQSRGSRDLDASVLLMAQLDFISPADTRWVSTLEAIGKRLVQDESVMRYDTSSGVDGLPGGEGTFTPCSFWYIEALTLSGEINLPAYVNFGVRLNFAGSKESVDMWKKRSICRRFDGRPKLANLCGSSGESIRERQTFLLNRPIRPFRYRFLRAKSSACRCNRSTDLESSKEIFCISARA
jgi:GH15 family glucan-1,4-alpha-glucosidase